MSTTELIIYDYILGHDCIELIDNKIVFSLLFDSDGFFIESVEDRSEFYCFMEALGPIDQYNVERLQDLKDLGIPEFCDILWLMAYRYHLAFGYEREPEENRPA